MSRLTVIPFALALAATPVVAQTAAQTAEYGLAVRQGSQPGVSSVRPLYSMVEGYVTRSAEQMPEEKYSYRPTPEVRTFGEIIGHVADSQFMFCALAKGEDSPSKESYEKVTTKAGLVAGLKASNAYCDDVYGTMTDARGAEMVKVFGQDMNRLGVLNFNMGHDFEHYGNLVTYLRLNGMVPPSSQGGN